MITSLGQQAIIWSAIALISLYPHAVSSTSIKMDFLPLGDVRTDPIITQTCLSDHVHTFYGVNKMRPETTYEDLRAATGNTGNVEENKSLYWHPTVYSMDRDTGELTKDEIWFGSSYYIWTTGQATAFPNGFQMIAGRKANGKKDKKARANAECVGPSPCERENCATNHTFFPKTACAELEVSMAFPTCWDGENLSTPDQSHVSYDIDGGAYDGDCPSSHPVKLPEVWFFFRIAPYSGGQHLFADGSEIYHADYMSGWDADELQTVLDTCENYSEAPNPDAWCEDHLTFRDAPKQTGDEDIVSNLEPLQPPTFDVTTITDEVIDDVTSLPRITCSGTLKPADGGDNDDTGGTNDDTGDSDDGGGDNDTCTRPGSKCYKKRSGPGCDEPTCEDIVCGKDPSCCSGSFGKQCVNKAKKFCNMCECEDLSDQRYLHKVKKGVAKTKKCSFLKKTTAKKRQKACSKFATFGDYESARFICPSTCELPMCPGS